MKKIVLFSLIFALAIFTVSASEVGDLLDRAKDAYNAGDKTTAIQSLDEAKKIIELESLAAGKDDYVEISNWDIVKMKKSQYVGRKIKIAVKFMGINSDGTIWLSDVGLNNPYEDSLVDKILGLIKYKEYIFYGTVLEGNIMGPSIHIEAIE